MPLDFHSIGSVGLQKIGYTRELGSFAGFNLRAIVIEMNDVSLKSGGILWPTGMTGALGNTRCGCVSRGVVRPRPCSEWLTCTRACLFGSGGAAPITQRRGLRWMMLASGCSKN